MAGVVAGRMHETSLVAGRIFHEALIVPYISNYCFHALLCRNWNTIECIMTVIVVMRIGVSIIEPVWIIIVCGNDRF